MNTVTKKLNAHQELFCQLFVGDEETRGNGMRSYAKAYNRPLKTKGDFGAAAQSGSRLLRNVHVSRRISELLQLVLDDNLADNELAYVIEQKDELMPKVAAIKEYNKLKQRIREPLLDGGIRVLVLPAVLINKNGIPISNSNTQTGIDSSRPAQIQSGEGGA